MNIRKLIYLLIVLCIPLIGSTLCSKVYAAGQSLRVSPAILQITLEPGTSMPHEVTIENLTDAPLPLRATLNDFLTTGEEGGYTFEDSKQNPLLSWITLSDTDFLLAPKEKKKILVTIKTPRTIPVGGYYGILFFEPVLQAPSNNGTHISTKVGILMLANLGVTDPHAKKEDILAFSIPFLNETGNVPFLLRVKNIALNYYTAKPMLTISPVIDWGQTQKPQLLEEKIIFPGKVRRWDDAKSIQNLTPNIYKASMLVSSGNGEDQTVEKYFLVFPYTQIILWGLVIGCVVVLIINRKRFNAAISALLRN